MKLFFSVGEPSGDRHAAEVVRRLRAADPGIECVGFGGPMMAAAGCKLHYELTTMAVMGFVRVLASVPKFYQVAQIARRYFKSEKPDAVVLIDFAGFNWWIAKYAKEAGVPVFFYCPPQLWGWAGWRIHKMRRTVDHLFCTLPFEYDFYRKEGMACTYVGHPFFEDALEHEPDHALRERLANDDRPLVLLLPGSRRQEVRENLPQMLKAARKVRDSIPDCRFVLGAYREPHAALSAEIIAKCADKAPVEIVTGKTPDLMSVADCCLAVSGSVSLELLHYRVPTTILYKVSPHMHWLQNQFRRVKYVTLVNLLTTPELHPKDLSLYDPTAPGADQIPFPEYLTCLDRSSDLAADLVGWLDDPGRRRRKVEQLDAIARRFGAPGASDRTAAGILAQLGVSAPLPAGNSIDAPTVGAPAPHFALRPADEKASRSAK